MSITTTNGMTILDDLDSAPNGPQIVQQLGNQVDAFYGKSVANAAALPPSGDFPGQRVWLTDVETHALWNASASTWDGYWKTFTSTLSGVSGTASAQWCRVGKIVTVEFVISATGSSSGNIGLSTPSTVATTARTCGHALAVQGSTFTGALVWLPTTTTVTFYGTPNGAAVGVSSPAVWGSGHKLSGQFSYREAD